MRKFIIFAAALAGLAMVADIADARPRRGRGRGNTTYYTTPSYSYAVPATTYGSSYTAPYYMSSSGIDSSGYYSYPYSGSSYGSYSSGVVPASYYDRGSYYGVPSSSYYDRGSYYGVPSSSYYNPYYGSGYPGSYGNYYNPGFSSSPGIYSQNFSINRFGANIGGFSIPFNR